MFFVPHNSKFRFHIHNGHQAIAADASADVAASSADPANFAGKLQGFRRKGFIGSFLLFLSSCRNSMQKAFVVFLSHHWLKRFRPKIRNGKPPTDEMFVLLPAMWALTDKPTDWYSRRPKSRAQTHAKKVANTILNNNGCGHNDLSNNKESAVSVPRADAAFSEQFYFKVAGAKDSEAK